MKTSIKIAMIMMIASIFTTPVFADDVKVGIGIGATEKGSTLYIPIRVPVADKNYVLVEPSLSYTNEETKWVGTNTDEIKTGNYGVGLFYGKAMTDNIDFLIGARASYTRQTDKNEFTTHTTDSKLDGYSIAPTIGIEYNVNKHIAVGGFVDYAYTKLDGKTTDTAAPGVETEAKTESFKPETNLFVKFFF